MNQTSKTSAKRVFSNPNNNNEPSPLSPQVEDTLVHLETILMLTQLNSTYFKVKINLHKATSRLEQSYFRIKMNAFLAIQNYRHNQLEVSSKKIAFESVQRTRLVSNDSKQTSLNNQQQSLVIRFQKYKKNADYQQIASNASVKCQYQLSRLNQLLIAKQKTLLSCALYRLDHHREATANIYSEKSSKIQTNDSQKSKLFRRSVEKKENRKSFSLQKSGLSPKHEFYVPVKYQPSRVNSQLSVNTQEKQTAHAHLSSMLNRFMQNLGDKSKERRNNLQLNRQKKEIKHSSTRKYNTSLINQQREEKISELDYLRRKYKKLIDQFSWFSERFLKVIEEEQYVQ